ncbi:hypothetical protein FRC12_018524, partial [Ceratobasidium sp. 428]
MYVEVSISTASAAQLASPSITSPSLHPDQSSADPVASSSRQPLEPTVPPVKSKKAKQPATLAVPDDANEPPSKPNGSASQAKPVSKKAPAPEAPVASANIAQPKAKKRARKSAAEDEATATTTAPSKVNDSVPVGEPADPPPPKKKRKSKAEADSYGPVAVSLPPPGPSQRKSTTATTAGKPISVATGSNAELVQRWVSNSNASTSKLAAPATEVVEKDPEVVEKPKKRRKKMKETPIEPVSSEPRPCIVCLKEHPGSGFPLDCPLLTDHGQDTIDFVDKRVTDLVALQGPERANQMAISRLKDWLKERAKEVEARNVFAPSISSTPVPQLNPTKAKKSGSSNASLDAPDVPRPVVPKKSKLSSVAVSHQSERSSTDDEDIVKSVMQPTAESDSETSDEDDAPDRGETPDPSEVLVPAVEPAREATPPPKSSAPPKPVLIAAPRVLSLAGPNKLGLSSQRMSRSDVHAFLDDLEDEEAGVNKEDDSDEEDDGGNDLAESTPSDVAKRRHRKDAQVAADDSDAESIGGDGDEDEDVEMGEVENPEGAAGGLSQDRVEPSTLSQILKSSQSLGGDLSQRSITVDKGKGKAREDDDIEEYESDRSVDEVKVIKASASSPIEPSSGQEDQQTSEAEGVSQSQPTKPKQAKQAQQEDEPVDGDAEVAVTSPPKKRGRPPLSQTVRDERVTEKVRIQAEKAAEKAEKAAEKTAAPPKKGGRPSLAKPVEEQQGTEEARETKPKKPRTSTKNGNTSILSVEIPLPKSRNTTSGAKLDVSRGADTTAEFVTPKKRGRPPLSQAVIEERAAEKEREKAEKKIKKLEARTAKANAKRKGNGGTEPAAEEKGGDKTLDSTASGDAAEPQGPGIEHEESHPEWEVLKPPPSSSSRANSSQVDEIELAEPALIQQNAKAKSIKKPTSIARSMLPKHAPTEEPDTESQSTAKSLSKPLFMPSSGLVKTNSSHPGPQPSSPLVPVATSAGLSLSQPTPSARRRSMAASTLPR